MDDNPSVSSRRWIAPSAVSWSGGWRRRSPTKTSRTRCSLGTACVLQSASRSATRSWEGQGNNSGLFLLGIPGMGAQERHRPAQPVVVHQRRGVVDQLLDVAPLHPLRVPQVVGLPLRPLRHAHVVDGAQQFDQRRRLWLFLVQQVGEHPGGGRAECGVCVVYTFPPLCGGPRPPHPPAPRGAAPGSGGRRRRDGRGRASAPSSSGGRSAHSIYTYSVGQSVVVSWARACSSRPRRARGRIQIKNNPGAARAPSTPRPGRWPGTRRWRDPSRHVPCYVLSLGGG